MAGDPLWSRIDVPVGISVIKQDGHFVAVPTPTHDEFAAAGIEGTDWFRGGYEYHVSSATEALLIADGFSVTYEGWGEGEYGAGGYGSGGLF